MTKFSIIPSFALALACFLLYPAILVWNRREIRLNKLVTVILRLGLLAFLGITFTQLSSMGNFHKQDFFLATLPGFWALMPQYVISGGLILALPSFQRALWNNIDITQILLAPLLMQMGLARMLYFFKSTTDKSALFEFPLSLDLLVLFFIFIKCSPSDFARGWHACRARTCPSIFCKSCNLRCK